MSVAPIVVGTDGSPSASLAVARAAELAEALAAPLHIVSCFESVVSNALASASLGMGALITAERSGSEHAQDVAARAAGTISHRGIETETHVCEGEPADALITLAAGVGAQMIVVGNRGMAGPRRVLGSVPNRVSHRADCAVLIVPTS